MDKIINNLKSKKIFLLIIQIAVTVFFLYFVVKALRNNWQEFPSHLASINYLYLIFSFFLFVVSFFILSEAWYIIIKKLGANLENGSHRTIYFYPKIATYAPGGIWNALGRIYLAKKEGLPRTKTIISLGMEFSFIISSGIFCYFIIIILTRNIILFFTAPGLTLLFLIAIGLYPSNLNRILRFICKVKGKSFDEKFKISDILKLFSIYCLYWIISGIAFYFLMSSIINVSTNMILIIIGINIFSWIIAFLTPFVAGGLGVMEVTMIYLLGGFFPGVIASLVPILNRVMNILSEGTTIGIVWIYNNFQIKKIIRLNKINHK